MKTGTILISRNQDETENATPGYWNHCAIYIDGGIVIEAQEGQGVIQTYFDKFVERRYEWIYLTPADDVAAKIAAEKAGTLIGLPYRKLSSLWPRIVFLNRGMNCVDAAFKVPYSFALNRNFSYVHFPDDVIKVKNVFMGR